MKRIDLLLVTIFLCSATFLFAGEKNKNNANEMAGWICNAKCVDQSSGKATCNTNCSEASGKVVFISDEGQVFQIASQEKVQPMAGKHCKMTAKKNPANPEELDVQNIIETRGP